jgi:hypothetical protein
MQLLVRGPWAGLRAVEAHEGATVASICGLDIPAAAAAAHGAGLVRDAHPPASDDRTETLTPPCNFPFPQRIVCGGRTLNPLSTVAAEGLPPCATLQLVARLRGGGGDGGSTGAESRSSYLEMYMGKRPDKVGPRCKYQQHRHSFELARISVNPAV